MQLSIMFQSFTKPLLQAGGEKAHVLCHLQYLVIYHTFAAGRGGGFQGLMVYTAFNIVSTISHTCAIGRWYRRFMLFDTFNNVSFAYHISAVGRVFRRLMFYATFNNVSVFFHTCGVSRGVQGARVLCHFQYCFNHLPHLCYRQWG